MMEEYRLLWAVADELHISFKVVRVASPDNKADAPSRHVDRDDYNLPSSSGRLSPGSGLSMSTSLLAPQMHSAASFILQPDVPAPQGLMPCCSAGAA
jgi:hypothetical protein